MRLTLLALAVAASGLASAQYSSINSTRLEPRFYNDVPGSTLTFGNIWPNVFFDDQNVSAPTGFANRHLWSLSNDNGATSFLFGGTDAFTLTAKIKLTATGPKNKEAGLLFFNDGNGDHIFLVKTGNNGEVAAFAGAFPFFSFTQQYDDHYVLGTTVTMSVTYFKDTDNLNKAIYRYNNHFSGALNWGNIEGRLLDNTRIGGYLQVENDANVPNNGGRGDFNDVTISPANKAFPEIFTVVFGQVAAGGRRSLYTTDGDALRMCRFLVPNQQVAPITYTIEGTSVYDTLSSLALVVNSRMVTAGLFSQTLDLFDWSTNSFSATDTRTDAINTTYAARTLNATGNVGRYLGPDHQVRGRVQIRQTGPTANPNWCAEFDEANFTVAK